MDRQAHWQAVYGTKASDELSWYQPSLRQSLTLIAQADLAKDAALIDVGGGDSTLIDDLLAQGYTDLTVLDISPTALARSRARLGIRGDAVVWLEADITRTELPADRYDLWHDRAVFHFLTQPSDRVAYIQTATRALKPGGHLIMVTFAADGPQKCSGLDAMRYDDDALMAEFGSGFDLVASAPERHLTPKGFEQRFHYFLLHKT